jgi:hypothetical protein
LCRHASRNGCTNLSKRFSQPEAFSTTLYGDHFLGDGKKNLTR